MIRHGPLEPLAGAPSIRHTERSAEAGVEPPVGSVGNGFDDAPAEMVVGLSKAEVVRRRGPWRGLEAVEFATLGRVDWSDTRLLGPIGDTTPTAAEERHRAQVEEPAPAARPTPSSLQRSRRGSAAPRARWRSTGGLGAGAPPQARASSA